VRFGAVHSLALMACSRPLSGNANESLPMAASVLGPWLLLGCLNRFTKRESPRAKVTSEVSISRRRRSPPARSALLSEASLY
jgi:hypothetical protein